MYVDKSRFWQWFLKKMAFWKGGSVIFNLNLIWVYNLNLIWVFFSFFFFVSNQFSLWISVFSISQPTSTISSKSSCKDNLIYSKGTSVTDLPVKKVHEMHCSVDLQSVKVTDGIEWFNWDVIHNNHQYHYSYTFQSRAAYFMFTSSYSQTKQASNWT